MGLIKRYKPKRIIPYLFAIPLGIFLGLILSRLTVFAQSVPNPATSFFFSNTLSQSYPANEAWDKGTLTQTEKTDADTVILTGPTPLLSQPVGTGSETSYAFDEPSATPVANSGVVALSTPTYDPSLLSVGQSVQFLSGAPPGVQPNLLANNFDPLVNGGLNTYNGNQIVGNFTGNNGSNLFFQFLGNNVSGQLDVPSIDWNGLLKPGVGTQWGFKASGSNGQENYSEAYYYFALSQPVVTDRLTFDVTVQPDALGGNGSCQDHTFAYLSGSVTLHATDGSLIYPPDLTFYNPGPPSTNASGVAYSGLTTPEYFSKTMLGEPVTIDGLWINIEGDQLENCNNGSFNGPIVTVKQVAAYAPVTNTSPVTVGFTSGGVFGQSTTDSNMTQFGNGKSVFDFKQTNSLIYTPYESEGNWDYDIADCSSGTGCYDTTGSKVDKAAVTEIFSSGNPGVFHSIDLEHVGASAAVSPNINNDFTDAWDDGNDVWQVQITGIENEPYVPGFWAWPGNADLILTLNMPDGISIPCNLNQFSTGTVTGQIDFKNLSADSLLNSALSSGGATNAQIQQLESDGIYQNPNSSNSTLQLQSIIEEIDAPLGSNIYFGNCLLYGIPVPILAGAGNVQATFISPEFDLGSSASSDNRPYFFDYEADAPPGTSLAVYVQTGTPNGSSINWSGYQLWPSSSIGSPIPGLGVNGGSRYFQYEVVMSHSDPEKTPVLKKATLKAGQYISPGSWTSKPLGLSQFFLPGPSSPMPTTMVSWRAELPPGTTLNVTAQTSGDSYLWSPPVNVPNGQAFTLPVPPATTPPSSGVYVQFTANLATTDPNNTPELRNLDFGFQHVFPTAGNVTDIATGTGIFFMPLDTGTSTGTMGISQSNQSVSPTSIGYPPPANSFIPYLIPFTPFENSTPGGDFWVSGYSQDYTGNVESPGPSQQVHIIDFTFVNPTDGEITNKPVTPVLNVDSGFTFGNQASLYVIQNGMVASGPVQYTFAPTGTGDQYSCPAITTNGTYQMVAQATANGDTYETNARFTINNTPPPQPTNLTVAAGAPSCSGGIGYTLNWDPEPSPVIGYTIVRDGVTIATNVGSPPYPDCIPTGTHIYEVYAVDNAGNISAPAEVSTVPSDVLVTDQGSINRVFELDPNSANLWQVPANGASSSPFAGILSACRIIKDGVDFGKTLVVDGAGAWMVDTTSYPGYPALNPPDPNPIVQLLPNGSTFKINRIEETSDGFYLMCASSTNQNLGGFVTKFFLNMSGGTPSPVAIWTVAPFVNPTSARELANGNVLVADAGNSDYGGAVVEVKVPQSGPVGQTVNLTSTPPVWFLDSSTTSPTVNHPNDAVQGEKTHDYYVADTDDNQVLVLDPATHALLTTIPNTVLNGPLAVDESQEGNAMVADTKHNQVKIFVNTGTASAPDFSATPQVIGNVTPYDVRSTQAPYQIQVATQGNNNVFLDNPFTFTVTLTDIHGQKVAGWPVNLSTNGSYGSFIPQGTIVQSATIDPNTGYAEGTVNFGGGNPTETVYTDNNGQATIAYFPMTTGVNPVTVFALNAQTLELSLDAQSVESIPVPVYVPPTDWFNTIADVVLSGLSTLANIALNSMGIPIVINLAPPSIGVGFDDLSASIGTDGTISGGFHDDSVSVGANYNINNGSFGGNAGVGPINEGLQVGPDGRLTSTQSLGPFTMTEDSTGMHSGISPSAIGSYLGQAAYDAINASNQPPSPAGDSSLNGVVPVPPGGYGMPPCAGGNPVNLSNGQLFYTSRDLFISGQSPQLAMEVRRTYNNLIPYSGSFGPQWNFEYDTFLYASPLNWTIYFGDGHQEVFTRNADGTCTPIAANKTSQLTYDPGPPPQWTYRTKDGRQYTFNTYGRVLAESDRWGNTITCSYDPATHLLSTVQDDSGRTLTFTYSGTGTQARLIRMVDPLGRVFNYNYDTAGDLVDVSLPDGRQVLYSYDSDHRLVSRDDPHQEYGKKTFAYRYDDHNRVVEESNGLGYSTLFTYATQGLHDGTVQVTTATNARGYTTTDTFDSDGNSIQEIDPRGGTKSYTYDHYHNRLTATNALGYTMYFTYDDENNLTSQTDALGNATSMTYDPTFNQMTSLTNALNKKWNYTYDDKGDLTGTLDPMGNSWSYTYYSQGKMKSATDPRSFTTYYTYDSYGDLASVKDPLNDVESYQYDIVGRKKTDTDPVGNVTRYYYDAGDNLTQILYADGSVKSFVYDNRNDLVSMTDEDGHATKYSYDAQDQKLTETDPSGGVMSYVYDPVGNLLQTTDPMGNIWIFTYNENNWLTSVTNQDEGTQTFTYDANGNKTSWTDAESHTNQFQYDADNHLTAQIDPNGKTMTYQMDALERVSAMTDKTGHTTHFSFDDDGRISEVTDADDGNTTYTYDSMGNRTAITDQLNHATNISYDANGRVTQITRPEGDSKNYTYNANGLWETAQVTGCSCGTKTFAYNSRNRVSSITDEAGGVTRYDYDFAGNKTKDTDANGHVTTYAYDACNRLVRQTGPVGDVTQWTLDLDGRVSRKTDAMGGITSYQYNQAGRVTLETDPTGAKNAYTYNHVGKVTTHTDPDNHATTFTYDPLYNLSSKTDALGHITNYVFDAMGRQTQVMDANGHTTYFEWDPLSRLTRITDPSGGRIDQVWDLAGNLTSRTDQDGHTTNYAYDKDNRRVTQTDPLNGQRSWTYDGMDHVLSVTDENNNTENRSYDTKGRLVQVTDANGGVMTYAYDAKDNPTSVKDADDHTTILQYDAADQLTSMADALGHKTQYERDALHRVVKTTDALGFATQYQYDADSHPVQTIDPLGGKTRRTYDPAGNLIQVTDPNVDSTFYQYDALNRRVKETDSLNGVATTGYDAVGNVVQVVDRDGNATQFTYDPLDRLVQVTDAAGGTTSRQYDPAGNLLQITDPNGNSTIYTYDADNRRDTVTDARTGTSQLKYDAVGNLVERDDADTNATHYQYDTVNRLTMVTDPNTYKIKYTYDKVGNRTAVIDANNHETDFQYDAVNRLLSETDPIGNVIQYGYDAVNDRTSRTDAKGARVMKFDGDRRLVEEDLADGRKVTYAYDACGRRIQATDWNGSYGFTYDAVNRLTKKTLPGGKAVQRGYDPAGNLTSRTDFLGGKYAYGYDTLNRPIQVTNPLGGITGIVYDKMNHVLQYHHPNGTSVVYDYDPTYDVLSVVDQKDSGSVIGKFAYTYDAVGNKLTEADNLGKTTYGYDNDYWLTSVQYPDRPAVSYTYDPAGNRTGMTVGTQTTTYQYDAANELTQAGNTNYSYDGNGNRVQAVSGGNTTTYAYDTLNHLVQVGLPDGTRSLFNYDYTGMRISDTEPGPNGNPQTRTFLWDGTDVLNEDSPYGFVSYNVLNGVNLSKTILGNNSPSPGTLYYHFDGVGSVADVTDPGANVLTAYRNDVFGQTLSGGVGHENDLQFVGEYGVQNQARDGILYMRNRWYDPEVGRFLTRDPIGFPGGINLYDYTSNNPLNLIDPLGLWYLQLGGAGNLAGGGWGGTAGGGIQVGTDDNGNIVLGTYTTYGAGASSGTGAGLTGTIGYSNGNISTGTTNETEVGAAGNIGPVGLGVDRSVDNNGDTMTTLDFGGKLETPEVHVYETTTDSNILTSDANSEKSSGNENGGQTSTDQSSTNGGNNEAPSSNQESTVPIPEGHDSGIPYQSVSTVDDYKQFLSQTEAQEPPLPPCSP